MMTLFTKEELIAKGIKKSDILRLKAHTEKLIAFYARKHVNGNCSKIDVVEWDNACLKWDHLKTTLNNFGE